MMRMTPELRPDRPKRLGRAVAPPPRRDGPANGVNVVVAVTDILRRGTPVSEAFPALVDVLCRAMTLDAVAIVAHRAEPSLLVHCAPGSAELHAHVAPVSEAALRYFEGTGSLAGRVEAAKRSGRRWICLPLAGDDGAVVGLLAVVTTVAPAEDTVALLACVARHLARAVAEADANALARAMVAERDRMLATVSHDLRNPLGVILLSAANLLQAIGRRGRTDAGRRPIEAIQRNARRMTRLVADLLDLDAIESGTMSIVPRRCAPRALVASAVEDIAPIAAVAGIALRTHAAASLPDAWADPERVVQILTNVLTNALKFTPRGGRVTVSVARPRATDPALRFSVRDTGTGIAAADLPRVFERRWQTAASAAQRLGSGLGLAICKSLVEQSGGRIWIESRLGLGTTVRFELPIAGVTPGAVSGVAASGGASSRASRGSAS